LSKTTQIHTFLSFDININLRIHQHLHFLLLCTLNLVYCSYEYATLQLCSVLPTVLNVWSQHYLYALPALCIQHSAL